MYVNKCWIIYTVLHGGLSLFRWKTVEIKYGEGTLGCL